MQPTSMPLYSERLLPLPQHEGDAVAPPVHISAAETSAMPPNAVLPARKLLLVMFKLIFSWPFL